MSSYPLVMDLPEVLDTRFWEWEPFIPPPPHGGRNFYCGIDPDGNRWLTKMRGSFCAYRELVFERLVQRAGWLCQSSCFAILSASSLPRKAVGGSDRVQLATRMLSEHSKEDCSPHCPIAPLRGDDWLGRTDTLLALLAASPLQDALNKARCEILAPILGGNEPAGCLTTVDHRVFMIDGEQMFSTEPDNPMETEWWNGSNGQSLTYDVCRTVGSFADADLEVFLRRPQKLALQIKWPIKRLLYLARSRARSFVQGHPPRPKAKS
jgi:hypothetical protein